MRLFLFVLLCSLILAPVVCAEDAAELREKGIAALKDSQEHPRAIVDAARAFAKAQALYMDANDEEKAVEMNSFLYWCKKKMTMQDIEAFTKGGESAVAEKIEAVEKLAPKADESQKWFDRAEKFSQENPNEHLLIAVRFYEVADRFKGSDNALAAMDRSLKELLQEKSNGTKATLPPVAVRSPDAAPASSGSRPVPGAEELKKSEKLIKELFKAEYAKTDAPGRLALIPKLLQQAEENKADAASEFVLLHEARDLAVMAGNAALATDAQKRLRDAFKMDFSALLLDLKRLEASAKTAESAAALTTLLSLVADDALAVENFDQAVRFNSRAEELLPLINDAALKARLKTEIPRVQELKRDSVAALAAQKTLLTKPDDPEANLIAGKFALKRGQFVQAFAMLAKSKDDVLSSMAKRELTPSAEAPDQVTLADNWFDRAEKEPNAYLKTRMQERATLWYGNALPTLTGLQKVKVEKRVAALTVQVNSSGAAPRASASARAVDLIGLVNLKNDTISGHWSKTSKGLLAEPGSNNRIRLPFHPPAEYELTVKFTRLSGSKDISVILYACENQAEVVLGGWDNSLCGIMTLNGKSLWDNATKTQMAIEIGKPYELSVEVRKDGIGALLDGKPLFEYRAANAIFTLAQSRSLNDPKALGLLCNDATAFHSCVVVEKSFPPPVIEIVEKMGYSIRTMQPGVSTHNNAFVPLQEIPKELAGKQFTQVVSQNDKRLKIRFLKASKIYILLNISNQVLYAPDLAVISPLGKALSSVVTSTGGSYEVWSIQGKVGQEIDLPHQAGVVADEMILKSDNAK